MTEVIDLLSVLQNHAATPMRDDYGVCDIHIESIGSLLNYLERYSPRANTLIPSLIDDEDVSA